MSAASGATAPSPDEGTDDRVPHAPDVRRVLSRDEQRGGSNQFSRCHVRFLFSTCSSA
jgi:hypothetical protein